MKKPKERCTFCEKPLHRVEGCSKVDCPSRRSITVQIPEGTKSVVYNGIRREPTNKE